MTSLRRILVRGSLWTGAGVAGSALIEIIAIAILARLLPSRDFGIVAAVAAIAGFASSAAEIAVGSAIVQHAQLGRRELSSVFWALTGITAAFCGAIVAASPWLAVWFRTPEVALVAKLAMITALLSAGAVVPLALLRRELRFGEAGAAQTIGSVAGGAAGIALALAGWGFGALVAKTLVSAAARTLYLWLRAKWLPSLRFRLDELRAIGGHSGAMMAVFTFSYWSRNVDSLLVGRFLGVSPLGYYTLGQRLINMPWQLFWAAVWSLLHPVFATVRDDKARVRGGYLQMVEAIMLVSFPAAAFFYVVAAPLVRAVWGAGWEPAIGVVQAFAPILAFQPPHAVIGPVFLTFGAMRIYVRAALFQFLAVTAGIAVGLFFGPAGAAWGYTLSFGLLVVPVVTIGGYVRVLNGRVLDLLALLPKPLLGAAAVALASRGAALLTASQPSWIAVLVITAAAFITTIVYLRLTAWDVVLSVLRGARRPDHDFLAE